MTTPMMYAVQAAALWSGLLILLLLVLSGIVVSGRRKHMVSLGDGGIADLAAATRAFGNCAEYAAPGMIGLLEKSLYGTRSAAKNWQRRLSRDLSGLGFTQQCRVCGSWSMAWF